MIWPKILKKISTQALPLTPTFFIAESFSTLEMWMFAKKKLELKIWPRYVLPGSKTPGEKGLSYKKYFIRINLKDKDNLIHLSKTIWACCSNQVEKGVSNIIRIRSSWLNLVNQRKSSQIKLIKSCYLNSVEQIVSVK